MALLPIQLLTLAIGHPLLLLLTLASPREHASRLCFQLWAVKHLRVLLRSLLRTLRLTLRPTLWSRGVGICGRAIGPVLRPPSR